MAEGVDPDRVPADFPHRAPVPGLVNQARPRFADVDQFESRELYDKWIREGKAARDSRPAGAGITRQKRSWFWFRRTFPAPARRDAATLKINKAQFGIKVWLNGRPVGEHPFCFTAAYFDLESAVIWQGENVLVVRIGAHPGMVPPEIPAGTDFEKLKWTPGIYDSVSVRFSDGAVIETVQVAPRLADSSVLVETVLRNRGQRGAYRLQHRVRPWTGPGTAMESPPQELTLEAGEVRTVRQTIPIPRARLWTPETPFLYVLETSTGGDSQTTRFGMREFRFDTTTKRAYLNGEVYFLRGSNITLHRFFEDPAAGELVWNEAWVRKLLVDIPRSLHWNAMRFCIGPAPDFWFDIADEAGLLIQNEFFIWTGGEGWNSWHDEWSIPLLKTQYGQWMRDHWNHPSVALWDASNETVGGVLAREVIPEVRVLDLSGRPWENGYAIPVAPDDPVEDHPYLFSRNWSDASQPGFDMRELERMTGAKTTNSAHPTGHTAFINEYGWLWLNRDGTPTELTRAVYSRLLGEDATPEERLELNGYLLGGLTEFWRAHRNFAGVLHFVYLTCSYPGVFTSDHFRDVRTLELHEPFVRYLREAFRPLGVYINFWQPAVTPATRREVMVMMVNDTPLEVSGELAVWFEGGAGPAGEPVRQAFWLPVLGQQTYPVALVFPPEPGEYVLKAAATPRNGEESPTLSVRKFRVEKR
ncbi:MAG: hypothetical protein Kow001_14330 [Acidobacteriota bacterium]